MLQPSSSRRDDAVSVTIHRALKVRLETKLLQSKLVEKRIEHEHANALAAIRKSL